MPVTPTVYPLGDQALTIQFGNAIDPAVNQYCIGLAETIAGMRLPGIRDVIPSYNTVSMVYDAIAVAAVAGNVSPYEYLQQKITGWIAGYTPVQAEKRELVKVPACFDPAVAPDLPSLAASRNISEAEFVERFTSVTYRVYLLGFIPGFAYMGKVDEALALPRKKEPCLVEPGSIGIAGTQTGIYPLAVPGGWNIIGRTPLLLFDKKNDPPCFFQPGDEVRFVPVTLHEFHYLNANN
ncbi:MAG TPA: 5-oxoprolinase subunit PxpB [Chitinophagaceae bacterium]